MESLLATERAGSCELGDEGGPEAPGKGGSGVCKPGRTQTAAARETVGLGAVATSGPRWAAAQRSAAPAPSWRPWTPHGPPSSPRPPLCWWLLLAPHWVANILDNPHAPPAEEGLLTCGWLSSVYLVTVPPHRLLGHHVIQVSYLRQPLSGLHTG